MSAVNHDTGKSDQEVIVLFAQLALIFIDEFVGEILDLLGRAACDIFGLLEEESGGIL